MRARIASIPSACGESPEVRGLSLLDRLGPDEVRAVLYRLLDAHPDLAGEAEQWAVQVFGQVSLEAVARDVKTALCGVSWRALDARAGHGPLGYTAPADAAWELLHEAVEPFLGCLRRALDLGLHQEALAWCQGIVLGLYHARAETAGILGWASDFPAQAAVIAVGLWRDSIGEEAAELPVESTPHFPVDFIDAYVPAWRSVLMVLR